MTQKQLVIAQINHEETVPLPFMLGMEENVAGRVTEHYGHTDWRRKIAGCIVNVAIVDPDRPTRLSDIRTQDAFGSVWRDDLRPKHHEKPGLEVPCFDGYDFPAAATFIDAERRDKALEACRNNADKFLTAGFGWGLFERSWTIRGFQNALMDAVAEPDFYEELVDRIMHLHLDFIQASVKLPVDGVMFSDDWGDQRGVLVGPERWRRFLKPRLARLYDAVHDAGKYTLSHCCGNVRDIIPDLIEIGLDVLQSVQPEAMDPYELKRDYGDKITFWGGLGSQSVLPFGTPEQIRAEVRRLCREMGRGGGYILGPAKALQPETPTLNAVAAIEAFAEFSNLPRNEL